MLLFLKPDSRTFYILNFLINKDDISLNFDSVEAEQIWQILANPLFLLWGAIHTELPEGGDAIQTVYKKFVDLDGDESTLSGLLDKSNS